MHDVITNRAPRIAGHDNFYLVSACALQGTARAPHYHVLRNDPELRLDEIEQLTFDLCTLYARAVRQHTQPNSYPPSLLSPPSPTRLHMLSTSPKADVLFNLTH